MSIIFRIIRTVYTMEIRGKEVFSLKELNPLHKHARD